MTKVGEVIYELKLSYEKFKLDAKNAENDAKKLSDKLSDHADIADKKTAKSFDGMGRNLLVLATKITAVIGVSRLMSDSFKDLVGLETARMSFEVLTGSVENASKVMKDVSEYARKTPFEFPEIAQATKLFLGYGVSQDKVGEIMRQVGDIAGATGSDIGGVSMALAQMFGRGKVTGDNMRQLIENGVNLRQELSDLAGIELKDFEKAMEGGVFTSELLQQALENATSANGKYFQGAEKLSKTLSGRLSTLKDDFTALVGKGVGLDFQTGLVKAGGLFDILSNSVKNLSDILSGSKSVFDFLPESFGKTAKEVGEYLIPKLENLWKTVTEKLIPALSDFWKKYIAPLIPVLGGAMVGALGLVIDGVNLIAEGIAWVVREINNGNPFIWGLIDVLMVLAGTKVLIAVQKAFETISLVTIPKVAKAFGGLSTLISSPMVMPAIAIVAALGAIYKVWDEYNKMKAAVEGLEKSTAQYNASKKADSDYLLSRSRDTSLSKADRDRAWQGYLNVMNRASGGPVSANMPYLVGENADGSINRTTELFVPRTSGTIVSSGDLQKALNGGRSVNMTNNYTVNNLADAQALSYEIAGKVKFA